MTMIELLLSGRYGRLYGRLLAACGRFEADYIRVVHVASAWGEWVIRRHPER